MFVDGSLAVILGVLAALESYWLVVGIEMKEFEDAGDTDINGVGFASGIATAKGKSKLFQQDDTARKLK